MKDNSLLFENPETQMRLYGVWGIRSGVFFDTEEDLTEYLKTNDIRHGLVCTIDFLGNFAGAKDVIKLNAQNGIEVLYTVFNEEHYGTFNYAKSIADKVFVWDDNYGSIRILYSSFRDRGIIFEDDVYTKVDEYYNRLMSNHEEKQKFDVMAVPCNRAFVVAEDKIEEFLNSKADPERRRKADEMLRKIKIKDETGRLKNN